MGDTITWIVATIIIVVLLVFFIFGSSLLAETKKIGKYKDKISSSIWEDSERELFLAKSVFTHYVLEGTGKGDTILKKLENSFEEKRVKNKSTDIKWRMVN